VFYAFLIQFSLNVRLGIFATVPQAQRDKERSNRGARNYQPVSQCSIQSALLNDLPRIT
jgi:hypothetical protein